MADELTAQEAAGDRWMCFELGQELCITASGERGIVVGRAEYLDSLPTYLLRYRSADGPAVEQWWNQSALEAAGLPA